MVNLLAVKMIGLIIVTNCYSMLLISNMHYLFEVIGIAYSFHIVVY